MFKLKTSYDHYSEAENSFSVTVSDPVMYGKIQLTKYALNTVSDEKQPEEDATFTVYLKSAASYDAAKETERDTRGFDLPKTGGRGNVLIYGLGIAALLTAGGITAFYLRKRRHG